MAKRLAKVIDLKTRQRYRQRVALAKARRELAKAGVTASTAPALPMTGAARSFLLDSFRAFFSKSIEAARKRRAGGTWPATLTR